MMKHTPDCSICRRISLWRDGRNTHFVHEFEHSILVVGDHQFHRGYCLLLLKEHVRELHELEPTVYLALSQELITAGRAIAAAYRPWKMNYSCYGNLDPHIHWHLFPRYDSEPDHLSHPWLHAAEFKDHPASEATAREVSARIREHLVTP
jgi:diadenosine tetraphosphate (Ap4A) HIT family hydrolase